MNGYALLFLLATIAIVLLLIGCAWPPLRRALRRRSETRAMRLFRQQREQLEAQFLSKASSLGKPRGLRWVDCDWLDSVTFGRDMHSGLLTAFVAVNIRFEAIEGGDMEGLEAVGMVRDASGVFQFEKGRWRTAGRALFNMNPTDAIRHLKGQVEPVVARVVHRSS